MSNLPDPATAAERVAAFLSARAGMSGIDQADIVTVWAKGEEFPLSRADLVALVIAVSPGLTVDAPTREQGPYTGPSIEKMLDGERESARKRDRRPSRAKGPQLKVFTVDTRAARIPRELADLVEMPSHNNQGAILIAAPTKKAAMERLAELRMTQDAREVRISTGYSANALVDAGHLAEPGAVLVSHDHRKGDLVALIRPGSTAGELVGTWRYADHRAPNGLRGRGGCYYERNDGRLFVSRYENDRPTPLCGLVISGDDVVQAEAS